MGGKTRGRHYSITDEDDTFLKRVSEDGVISTTSSIIIANRTGQRFLGDYRERSGKNTTVDSFVGVKEVDRPSLFSLDSVCCTNLS